MQNDHEPLIIVTYVLNTIGFLSAIAGVFFCKYVFKPQSLIDKLSFLKNMNRTHIATKFNTMIVQYRKYNRLCRN
jgi:hypothetical protein